MYNTPQAEAKAKAEAEAKLRREINAQGRKQILRKALEIVHILVGKDAMFLTINS